MEAANWIFDHNNNNNYQSPGSQSSQQFLNFDSPDANSDVSHSNLNYSNNQQSNLNHKKDVYGESPIDILDHHAHNHSHKDELNHWTPIPDLHDLDMNFFPNDSNLLINEGNHSFDEQNNNNNNNNNNNTKKIPPTPQSFEISSFQNSADSTFLQNFNSPIIDSNLHNSIRPDVVFTPLVSPAVTPMESMINKNHQQHTSNFFSPLTSPALEAKSPMKSKKSSSPEESSSSSSSNSNKKYNKRKTPGNTPIVGPTIPGRIAKQSPIIKAKRSSAYANNISYHHQQQPQQQLPNQLEDEVMAPPKSRRSRKSSQNTPATPATLMNFKIDNNNNNNPSSNQSSSSPLLGPDSKSRDEDFETSNSSNSKKTSHKLAEQGRRNRMNQAIQDLGCLIPEELSSNVSIPSKATTVELACVYIDNLSKENHYLREKLKQFNFELESNESISPLETTNNHSSS